VNDMFTTALATTSVSARTRIWSRVTIQVALPVLVRA
jgi:hypothetical protein